MDSARIKVPNAAPCLYRILRQKSPASILVKPDGVAADCIACKGVPQSHTRIILCRLLRWIQLHMHQHTVVVPPVIPEASHRIRGKAPFLCPGMGSNLLHKRIAAFGLLHLKSTALIRGVSGRTAPGGQIIRRIVFICKIIGIWQREQGLLGCLLVFVFRPPGSRCGYRHHGIGLHQYGIGIRPLFLLGDDVRYLFEIMGIIATAVGASCFPYAYRRRCFVHCGYPEGICNGLRRGPDFQCIWIVPRSAPGRCSSAAWRSQHAYSTASLFAAAARERGVRLPL